jgi:hypothetical protein
MFNPFSKFEPWMIAGFRERNLRYVVAQTFTRDNDLFKDENTISLLLSQYEDLLAAKTHLNAIAGDKYASIIDLEKETHRARLAEVLKNEKFHLYSIMITDTKVIKNALDKIFSEKIRNYISKRTTWRIGGSKTIYPEIEATFGELFVVLKYSGETIRVTLEEIERY